MEGSDVVVESHDEVVESHDEVIEGSEEDMEGSDEVEECSDDPAYKMSDVWDCLDEGDNRIIGPLNVRVVNYRADNEHPMRFTYRGCTKVDGHGLKCSRPVSGEDKCDHNSETMGTWKWMFCFEVILVPTPPLRAIVFDDVATELLGLSPEDLNSKSEMDQMDFVHQYTFQCPCVEAYIRCAGGQATLLHAKLFFGPKAYSPPCRVIEDPSFFDSDYDDDEIDNNHNPGEHDHDHDHEDGDDHE